MKEQKVIVGEFEDEFYADVAKRDLETAGISAIKLKDFNKVMKLLSNHDKTVRIAISVAQLEQAKRILEKKFY